MRISIALLISAATILGGRCPALAEPIYPKETLTVRVSTAGLDLSTDAGARQLLGRLSQAATKVCGGRPDIQPLHMREYARFKACRAQAMARAVAQANAPTLERQFAGTLEARSLHMASN